MNYLDGQEVLVGDRVRHGDDDQGIVVRSIDADDYSDSHPKSQWGYLTSGIMVEFPEYELIHYDEAGPDLTLVERGSS